MSERDYYPAGAYDDPSAPYNETTPPEIYREVEFTATVHKKDNCSTTDYDGDGNTFDTDWEREWQDQHYTPVELLDEMSTLLQNIWDNIPPFHKRKARRLIDEAADWEEEEINVEEA